MVVFDRILQRSRDMLLPDDTIKIRRPVFSGGYYKIFHRRKI
jgi:hypothetical protein